jgi:large subunit ribosomal protein L9
MKVILLKDVQKIGRKYDIKDVSEGYALNMLIPRGLAQAATPQAVKKIEEMKSKDLTAKKIQDELLMKSLKEIDGLTINLKEKANEKGHLFAGITKERLLEEILKITRLHIDPESIKLHKPIKETGEHKVLVEVMDKKAEFVVSIEAK